MNDIDVPNPSVGKRLLFIFLGAEIAWLLLELGVLPSTIVVLAAPVLSTYLVIVALRYYSSSQGFLRVFVATAFIATVLTNFYCATLAHDGAIIQVALKAYRRDPFLPGIYTLYLNFLTQTPLISPMRDYVLLDGLRFLALQYNVVPTGPLFLLLMLFTPRFLALPIFWLWAILNVLYVVLPQRIWGWMKAAMVQGLRAVLRQH